MSAPGRTKYAVLAKKASTGVEVVFALHDDELTAPRLADRLRSYGIEARVERTRAGATWAGANWRPRAAVGTPAA